MQNLIQSKRFWAAISALIIAVAGDKLPFSEEQVSDIVMVIAAWIVGDSLRKTDPSK